MLVLTLLATFHYQIAVLINRHLLLVSAATCVVSFVIAISVGERWPTYLLLPAALAVSLSAYAIFTHARLYAWLDESFPRPLPYPDRLINSAIQSIPSPDHQLNRTWQGLVVAVNLCAIMFSVMSGIQIGMVLRPIRKSREILP